MRPNRILIASYCFEVTANLTLLRFVRTIRDYIPSR